MREWLEVVFEGILEVFTYMLCFLVGAGLAVLAFLGVVGCFLMIARWVF